MHRPPTPATAPFIAGNLWRHLINMTLARSVGILATFIVDFVDILFISHLDDAHLIAAIGFAAAALYFIRAVAIALGITTTVLVARAIGSGDRHRAARYAWDTSAFSFLLLTLLAALAWFAREPILATLGARGASLHHAADYLAIDLIGLPLLALGNCGTSTLFALGSARLAMLVSLSATVTQAVLDPILIFACGWGLQGAALASLAAQGVREINLLGQNVNAYRGALFDGGTADLALLIEYVAAIDGIDRVRFTTSHPVEFTDNLIEVYRRVPQLVSHLHLPVQSGSDKVLALMKRGHKAAQYKEKLARLREIRPNISFSSDFIVGFPGEEDADFEATMQLIEDVFYDTSFSFIYSPRPGTPAAAMPDRIPMDVKKARLARLQARILQMAAQISADMVGSEQWVLVDGVSKKNDKEVCGRTENNRVVNFQAPHALIGRFAKVQITAAYKNSLRGRLIEAESQRAPQRYSA